jgi:hypothetical protein
MNKVQLLILTACILAMLISCNSGRTPAQPAGTPQNAPAAPPSAPPQPPGGPATRAAPATPGTYTLGSGGALCGKEKLETALAYRAVQSGDKAGVVGLVARGEVDYLEAETTVHAFSEDGEFSRVSVTSGTDLGKQCWMPTKMLGTRNNSN